MRRVPSGEKYASAFSPPLVSWRRLRQMALAGGLPCGGSRARRLTRTAAAAAAAADHRRCTNGHPRDRRSRCRMRLRFTKFRDTHDPADSAPSPLRLPAEPQTERDRRARLLQARRPRRPVGGHRAGRPGPRQHEHARLGGRHLHHGRRPAAVAADDVHGSPRARPSVVCLDIPDVFTFLQPELVQLLQERVPPTSNDRSRIDRLRWHRFCLSRLRDSARVILVEARNCAVTNGLAA